MNIVGSATTKLLSLFPVPQLLSLPSAGLEISEHSVKHLNFVGRQQRRIDRFGNCDLPAGIIERGEIVDAQSLIHTLRAMRTMVGTPYVHVSLPEQKGYVFKMLIPKGGDLSVREAVEFRIEENVPLQPANIIFDCEPLPLESNETQLALNITAFPRSTVEMYYVALVEAGFVPLSFEIESQAAARALVPTGDTQARMIVDFGETRTALSVIERGVVRFTTSLDLAGGLLREAVMKQLQVTPEEAIRLKNEEGLTGLTRGSKVAEALLPTLTHLRDEINRHFVYWRTHGAETGTHHQPISSIILCGGSSNALGLPEFLTASLRTPVSLASVWQNAFSFNTYIPPIPHNESLRFATVAGLALRRGASSL